MENFLTLHPWVIILFLLWTFPWKGVALWKAARRGSIGWFVILLLVNTLAILDIIYIFLVDNDKKQPLPPVEEKPTRGKYAKYRELVENEEQGEVQPQRVVVRESVRTRAAVKKIM